MKEKLDLIPSYQFGFLHKRASIKKIKLELLKK